MPDGDINQALGMEETAGAGASGKDPAVMAALRYKDGYRKARTLEAVAMGVKIFGVIVGLLVSGLCVTMVSGSFSSSDSGFFLALAILIGAMSGGSLFVLGVVVSAMGQQIKATLDSAVNTSPFLDVPAKARAMSID